MLQWYNIKQFSQALGVCPNTFKKNYLPHLPNPQRQNGKKKYWTGKIVSETIDKIERGEFTHNPHTEN